jgi:hypothetical protein
LASAPSPHLVTVMHKPLGSSDGVLTHVNPVGVWIGGIAQPGVVVAHADRPRERRILDRSGNAPRYRARLPLFIRSPYSVFNQHNCNATASSASARLSKLGSRVAVNCRHHLVVRLAISLNGLRSLGGGRGSTRAVGATSEGSDDSPRLAGLASRGRTVAAGAPQFHVKPRHPAGGSIDFRP